MKMKVISRIVATANVNSLWLLTMKEKTIKNIKNAAGNFMVFLNLKMQKMSAAAKTAPIIIPTIPFKYKCEDFAAMRNAAGIKR